MPEKALVLDNNCTGFQLPLYFGGNRSRNAHGGQQVASVVRVNLQSCASAKAK